MQRILSRDIFVQFIVAARRLGCGIHGSPRVPSHGCGLSRLSGQCAYGLYAAHHPAGFCCTQAGESASSSNGFCNASGRYVDAAMRWGVTHGIGVMIDIHAAPGSQNGCDQSGRFTSDAWSGEDQCASCVDCQDLHWPVTDRCLHSFVVGRQVES